MVQEHRFWRKCKARARPDFGENVKGGGKIFEGGVTMISRTEQQMRTVSTNLSSYGPAVWTRK